MSEVIESPVAVQPEETMVAETPKLTQPRSHKATVMIWADLTVNDMDRLEELCTPDQIKAELAKVFQLEDYKDNLKTAVLIDLYFYILNFAHENHFSKPQTSAFFAIVKRTHEVCIETPFGNVDECFAYFRELILSHAVKRPPFSIDLFSPDEVRKITTYVINTYFRHFKMYKYVFTPLVRLDLSMTYIGRPETPPPEEVEKPDDDVATKDEQLELDELEECKEDRKEDEEEKQEEEATAAEPPQPEESPAASELRTLIKDHLADEIKKLKVTLETKLKESEDVMNQKLSAIENTTAPKSQRASGKRRK